MLPSHPAPTGPRVVAFIAGALVVGASLVAAAPASADAPYEPVCPSAHLYKGIELVPTPALVPYDRDATLSVSAGALPMGVTLTGDAATDTPYVYAGTPTMTGTSTFTVKAVFEDQPSKTVACKVEVAELPAPTRIQGTDRFDQAAKVVASKYATAETVYLASGEVFADALSAGSVAGVHGAPLLLTKSGELPPITEVALERLAPKHIVVVGGPATITPAVFDRLVIEFATAEVVRISGADRYAVSRALIEDGTFGAPSAPTAYVADGRNFPDALSASPAAVSVNGPVLLVNGGAAGVAAAEFATLDGLGVAKVRIAGGLASVGKPIEDGLKSRYDVMRAAGADRFEAAVNINAEAFAAADTVYLASGEVFPDALSAGPIAGENSSPIFLSRSGCIPPAVLDAIERLAPTRIVILGGTATLGTDIDHLKGC